MRIFLFAIAVVFLIGCKSEEANTLDENTILQIDQLKKENLNLSRTLNGRDSLVNNYARSINDIRLNLCKN